MSKMKKEGSGTSIGAQRTSLSGEIVQTDLRVPIKSNLEDVVFTQGELNDQHSEG